MPEDEVRHLRSLGSEMQTVQEDRLSEMLFQGDFRQIPIFVIKKVIKSVTSIFKFKKTVIFAKKNFQKTGDSSTESQNCVSIQVTLIFLYR